MRIERTGKIEPLTPRVERYLREGLKGKSLDDLLSPEQERCDYLCLNGLVVVEVKTLEGDGTERLENYNDELRDRDDYPTFYAGVPFDSILKNLKDPEPVQRRMLDRIGRAIVSHVKKARHQFESHAKHHPRKNQVRVMILINEDHEIYDPHTVGYILNHTLLRRDNEKPTYENIDAVIYLTERHATNLKGQVAFPILALLGPGVDGAPWKVDIVNRITEGWASHNGNPMVEDVSKLKEFEAVDHVPEKMKRHEFWRLEYRRNPYMQNFTEQQIRDVFDETIVFSILAMTNGSPLKFTQEAIMADTRRFTHVLMEINKRGLPMESFDKELPQLLAAATRMKLPPIAHEYLKHIDSIRMPRAS